MDDNFFIRSPSLLSRTSTRRSHTPTPRLHRNNSRSGRIIDSLKRSTTRTTVTSPVSTKTSNDSLRKLMSPNSKDTPIAGNNLSRSTSRRSTTPIIFSQSTRRRKPQHVEKKLECSLEELCFGAIRKIKITRDVISDVGYVSLSYSFQFYSYLMKILLFFLSFMIFYPFRKIKIQTYHTHFHARPCV